MKPVDGKYFGRWGKLIRGECVTEDVAESMGTLFPPGAVKSGATGQGRGPAVEERISNKWAHV